MTGDIGKRPREEDMTDAGVPPTTVSAPRPPTGNLWYGTKPRLPLNTSLSQQDTVKLSNALDVAGREAESVTDFTNIALKDTQHSADIILDAPPESWTGDGTTHVLT